MDHVEGGSVYHPNRVKQALAAGGHSFGTWIIESRQPSVIRRVADAGYDHAFIEMESSSYSWETVADFCEVARARNVVPIVRPADLTRASTLRLLEIGASGVMFHDVDDRDEVEQIRDWLVKSKAVLRSDAARGSPQDAILLAIQIETVKGLEAVESIMKGGGVDLVEIGRGDLASELGYPGQREHPKVQEAIDHIIAACDSNGIAVGVTCLHPADVADMARRGVRCLTYAGDTWFLRDGLQHGVQTLRAQAPQARRGAQPAAPG